MKATIERECCSEQHTEVTPSEATVQFRSSRPTPKALRVVPVSPGVVESLIVTEHYLHSMPAAARLCLGVYWNDVLVGAVVFTSGPRHGYRLLSACKPQDVAVLARLWLSDDLPKNSESRVIGYCLRWIRKHRPWKLILSYADPKVGHCGTIYQSTGWEYLGRTAPGSIIALTDGKEIHSRTCGDRYGSGSIGHLRRTGIPVVRLPEPPKHRYVFILDKSWRWRLRAKPQPYPKLAPDYEQGPENNYAA